MGQYSPLQLPNKPGHQVVHKQSIFPIGHNVLRRQPRSRSTHLTAPAHSGGQERTGTPIFHGFGLSLPMVYKIRTKKKNRKKILRRKNYPLPFAIFFLFRFKEQFRKISGLPFSPLKFNVLFTFHEENTTIAEWQDLASLKNRRTCSNFPKMM